VSAIDEADDRTMLARLAHVIARRYTDDPIARELAGWIEERGRELGGPPSTTGFTATESRRSRRVGLPNAPVGGIVAIPADCDGAEA
jgi:hypothetical protein